jgi:ADP-ribose pyrophosphatase YjhB (NUDIX family)|tara:strand:- start:7065 stop:7697 length:633 start_codon:yes stop_codon:yes gene_type:complete
MYKVFLNHKPLILTTSIVENDDSTPLIYSKFSNYSVIIKALKSKKTKCIYYYNSDSEKLIKHLHKHFPPIEAAGGLVKNDKNQFLVIYRNGKWDLPKGHLEKKEMIVDGALREVIEETGVRDLVSKSILPTTYHLYKKNGEYSLKKTYWFLMSSNYKGNLNPQIKENIEKAVWKNKTEIKESMKNMYSNIEMLFNFYFEDNLTGDGTKDL